MAAHELVVVAGALARAAKSRVTAQDAIARRWRLGAAAEPEVGTSKDVIPLLDGWIRRLEREAGES